MENSDRCTGDIGKTVRTRTATRRTKNHTHRSILWSDNILFLSIRLDKVSFSRLIIFQISIFLIYLFLLLT